MELKIKRMEGGIDVYCVVDTDAYVEARFIDHDAFRIHRNTKVSDFLRHLLTNAVFVHGAVLTVASNALNFLLKLILLDVWREDLPGEIEERHNQKDSEECFQSLHRRYSRNYCAIWSNLSVISAIVASVDLRVERCTSSTLPSVTFLPTLIL